MNFFERKRILTAAMLITSVISALGIAHLLGADGMTSAAALIAAPTLYLAEKRVDLNSKIHLSFVLFAALLSGALFAGRIADGTIDFSFATPIYYLFVAKAVYNAAVLIFIKSEGYVSPLCQKRSGTKFFLVCWGVIFAAWLPYFFASYPGVFTYDAILQMNMALGNIPLTDHHPVAHTMLVKLFVTLGGGSPVPYIIIQMLALSCAFAFSVSYIRSKGINHRITLIAITFWFALNPLHAIYSINMQKDTLFGAAVLLLTIAICEIVLTRGKALKNAKWLSLFIISLLLVAFLRNNGPYVIILLAPFLIFAYKKYIKQMCFALGIVIVALLVVKVGVYNALDIQKGSFAESVAVPLQQISRVVFDGYALTEKQQETLETFISVEDIKDSYKPDCVDPLKSSLYGGGLDHQALSDNKGRFFSLWLELLFRHPGSYIRAYIDETIGYWDPLYSTPYISAFNYTAQNDCNIENANLIPVFSKLLGKASQMCFDMKLPIISLLFSMGVMLFAAAYAAIMCFKRSGWKILIVFLPCALVWLSVMISSPIAYHLRYLYCLFCVLPIFIVLAFKKYNFNKN